MVDTICKILGIARRTYFHWQKDEDKCYSIKLLNKYFKKEELEEFIETGSIKRQELIKDIKRLDELLEIEKKYNEIIKVIEGK